MAAKKVKQAVPGNEAIKTTEFESAATKAGIAPLPGKQAVKGQYRDCIEAGGDGFTHSIDLDSHFQAKEGNANRWDYSVGTKSAANVELAYWIEPHPASSTGEVKKMIEKLNWLKGKLNTPEFSDLRKLRDAVVTQGKVPYRWLATDATIRITANSREARELARQGLDMPRRKVYLA